MNRLSVVSFLAATCLTLQSQTADAISVTWGAAQTSGIGDKSGTPLAVGYLTLLGSFGTMTPDQIRGASFATLQANFINYDAADPRHIGDGAPVSGGATPTSADAGYFQEGNDTKSSTALGITGQTMYYWVFNATTLAAATQEGIFTAAFNGANASTKSAWVFPSDTAVPNTTTVDISDVVPYLSGTTTIDRNGIVIGGYGTGSAQTYPLYNLDTIAVPEPSTVVSCVLMTAIGGGWLMAKRRKIDAL